MNLAYYSKVLKLNKKGNYNVWRCTHYNCLLRLFEKSRLGLSYPT